MLVQAAVTAGRDLDPTQMQKGTEIRALEGHHIPSPTPTPTAGVIGQHAEEESRNEDVNLEKTTSMEKLDPALSTDREISVDTKITTVFHQEDAHDTNFEELD